MSLIGEIFVKFGLSSAAFHADVDKATSKFKQSAGEMKSAARKESLEARAAVTLLGEQIGVHLPREVRRFIASSESLRPALAAAFNIAIASGFAIAIGAAIVKALELGKAWLTASEELEKVEARVRGVTAAFNQMSLASLGATRDQLRAQQLDLQTRVEALAAVQEKSGERPSFKAAGEAIASARGIKELIPQMEKLRILEDAVTAAMANLTKEGMDKQRAAAKKLHDELVEAGKKIKLVDLVPPSLLTLIEKSERALAATREMGKVSTAMPSLGKELRDFGAEGRAVFEATRMPAERLATTLRELHELFAVNAISADTYARAVAQAKEQSGLLAGSIGKIRDSSQQMASIFVSNIGDMIVGARSFTEALGGIAQAITRMILQITLLEPLERFLRGIFGVSLGGAAKAFTGFTGALAPANAMIPGFAGGGHFSAGQMMTVGERGPELAVFDRPGTIIPHGAAGGVTVVNNIDARGAEIGVETRIADALRIAAPQIAAATIRAQQELSRRTI